MRKEKKLVSAILCLGLGLSGMLPMTADSLEVAVAQQETTCKGVVEDADGEPIIGASVAVKGTANGTITDMDGNFILSRVKKGDILVISFVGYKTVNLTYNGETAPLRIKLFDDTKMIEEVVVVGYGVQKKVNLTGSVSSVKADELDRRPLTDASQRLQGLIPGLLVTNSSAGRPGATGKLELRGQGNLDNNASPYVLVDGVEMSLSEVNPSDIENISVLKDAAACAIYGARAAYGVILVTTKKGQEGKMNVNYQGSVGWNAPTVLPKMVDSYRFATYWNDAATNAGSTRLYSQEKLDLLKKFVADPSSVNPWQELPVNDKMNPAFENSEKGIGNTDYFKLHYKDWAIKQNHNVSISGGTDKFRYYISGGYYKEEGILRYAKMDYTRYNLSSNMSAQLTKRLKAKMNFKFMNADNQTPFGDGALSEGFYHSLARFRPTVHYLDPNGHFTELSMVPYLQSGTYTDTRNNNFVVTPALEWQPLKNWFVFFDYTYKFNHEEYKALNVAPLIYAADGQRTSLGERAELDVVKDGKYTRATGRNAYQSINLYTNYLFTLADKHNFTLMAGYQEENNDYTYLKASSSDQVSVKNPNVGMGGRDKFIYENNYGWATRGFFGRVNYDFSGKYLIELNGRYDGSSRFASDHRWGFFPSVSLGWNIIRESFMRKALGTLSQLKLRASYGLLGNQAGAGYYTFASVMELNKNLSNYIFDTGRTTFLNAPLLVNSATTWEKVESKNIGLDFGFFNNALTGSLDLFRRDTKDMLGPGIDLPDYFGAESPKTNNANMKNTGWELVLNYRGKIGKDIDYTIGGSISDAVSVVTAYSNVSPVTASNPSDNWYSGKKVGEIWGYRADGLIQTQQEADEYNNSYDHTHLSKTPWTPGDVKYRDLNGDKKINNGSNTFDNMGDMTVIGNSTPRYQYTINGGVSWKNLSLNFMLQGVGKRDWNPGATPYFWGSGAYAQVTVFEEHMDYWRPDNTGAYYPKPYTHTAGGIRAFSPKTMTISDRYLQDASYLRLKNVTLSYNIPQMWVKKVGLNKVQVFFSGENLLTFTKLKGMFDPEAIFTENSYTKEGGKNYPMNKVVSFGLIVNL